MYYRLGQDHDLTERDEVDVQLVIEVVGLVLERVPAPQWVELSLHETGDGPQVWVLSAMAINTTPLEERESPPPLGELVVGETLRDALTEMKRKLNRRQ